MPAKVMASYLSLTLLIAFPFLVKTTPRALFVVAALGALYEAIWLIWPSYLPPLVENARNSPWELFWGNPNWFSQVLGFTVALYPKPISILLLIPILLAGSKSVALGLGLGLSLYLVGIRRTLIVGSLATLSYFIITPHLPESIMIRLDLYTRTFALILEDPWGRLPFHTNIETYRLMQADALIYNAHPDSDLLWLLAELGWVLGALAILLICVTLYFALKRARLTDALFVSLTITELAFQHPLGMPWFWLFSFLYMASRFPPPPPRKLAIIPLVALALHSYPLVIVTPFRTPDKHTQVLCHAGFSRACRLTGDWKTSLRHTPYDHHMIKLAALHTGNCLAAWLHDTMRAKPMFLSAGCGYTLERTPSRQEWISAYHKWATAYDVEHRIQP